MKINRNNYEAYFLDYHEKALDPGQVAELMVFLEENPDLNEEFEAFETIRAAAGEAGFENKRILKKKDYKTAGPITAFNYEQYMVASIEGDLGTDEREQLSAFLSINPEARLEFDFFRKTRLVPEEVLFTHKQEVKKTGIFTLYRREMGVALAIAASILIFLAFYLQIDIRETKPVVVRNNMDLFLEPLTAQTDRSTVNMKIELRTKHSLIIPISTPAEMNTPRPFAGAALTAMVRLDGDALELPGYEVGYGIAAISDRAVFHELLENNPLMDADPVKTSFAARFVKGTINKIFSGPESSGKSLLEYTVSGYNLISDREVEVEKQYDASGRVVAYHVNGEVIKFGRKVNPPMQE
jgi:hypothetical protein